MHRLWAALALTSLGGCTVIDAEVRHSGGYPGRLLDKRLFDASASKQLQLLRAAMVVAMVARAGTVYAHEGKESDAYVTAIVDAADEINVLAGHLKPVFGHESQTACELSRRGSGTGVADSIVPNRPTPVGIALESDEAADCFTYPVNFESDLPIVEKKVFRLTVLALPQNQARKFLQSAGGGNVMSAAWSAAKLAFSAANGLHSAAAVNRSTIEVLAAQAGCPQGSCETIDSAATWVFKNSGSAFSTELANPLAKDVNDKLMQAVMRNIYDSCRSVSLDYDESTGSAELIAAHNARVDACGTVRYQPRLRWKKPGF
jgi:hypothetical protein